MCHLIQRDITSFQWMWQRCNDCVTFLGVFSKLQTAVHLLAASRLPSCIRMEQIGSKLMNFHDISNLGIFFFEKSVEKIQA